MLLTIVVFIVLLSVLIFVHEFGHFWVARRCGLKPREFGFGFPPRVWGIYKDINGKWKTVKGRKTVEDASDTIYSVNMVPLGGFVQLGEDEEGGSDPNHFSNRPIWQRMAIILAGVTMNVVLAAVLISFGFMIGLPQTISDLPANAEVTDRKIQIMEVLPDSPAEAANFKMGDTILSVNGIEFINNDKLAEYTNEYLGEELIYVIKRGNEEFTANLAPVLIEETGKGGIGVSIVESGLVKFPFYSAIWEGLKITAILFWVIIVAFYELLKGLFMGQGVDAGLAGPIGIAALTGQMARMGFAYILQFAAILSINLAIINAFPFPALDGGRFLFLIIEKIKGSPVKKEVEAIIHNIGFAVLMLLILIVTFRDIAQYSGFFNMLLGKIF
ncbi:MAG: RIP metalloprotease RseP [Patescibacteria group bacterium]|nr:RIP metalloprotease RseP [Patescibacteria group bacterium]